MNIERPPINVQARALLFSIFKCLQLSLQLLPNTIQSCKTVKSVYNYYQTLFKSCKIATSMKTKLRVLNSTCNNNNLNNSFLYCIVGDWSSYEILHYPHFNVPD